MEKKLISIVTPVYNEEETINYYFDKIFYEINKLKENFDFEIILSDNNSSDNTFAVIKQKQKNLKILKLINYLKTMDIKNPYGLQFASQEGDAIIPIDCDLQDPPELLETFIEQWKKGYKIVYGVRTSRKENFLKTKKIVDFPMMRNIFYWLLNKISEDKIPRNVGDFMLLDRIIVDKIKSINDQNIYLRGVIFSLGFKRKSINYERKSKEIW